MLFQAHVFSTQLCHEHFNIPFYNNYERNEFDIFNLSKHMCFQRNCVMNFLLYHFIIIMNEMSLTSLTLSTKWNLYFLEHNLFSIKFL